MSKTILIVDDDPITTKLLSESLCREGFSIATAKDGLDAMVYLKHQKPDLMILDIMMPELNGYEVCQYVKLDERLKSMPILLFTVRERELSAELLKMAGIEYLHKSIPVRVIVDKMKQMMGLLTEVSE